MYYHIKKEVNVKFKDELERDIFLIDKIKSALIGPSTSHYNQTRDDIINQYGYDFFRLLQNKAFKKITKEAK